MSTPTIIRDVNTDSDASVIIVGRTLVVQIYIFSKHLCHSPSTFQIDLFRIATAEVYLRTSRRGTSISAFNSMVPDSHQVMEFTFHSIELRAIINQRISAVFNRTRSSEDDRWAAVMIPPLFECVNRIGSTSQRS